MSDNQNIIQLREILRHLAKVISSAALYSPEHPSVLSGIPGLIDPLQQFLAREPELSLIMADGVMLYLGKPLEQSPHVLRLARLFTKLGIGFVRIMPGVDAADLRQLIRCVCGIENLDILRTHSAKISIGLVDADTNGDDDSETTAETFGQLTVRQLENLKETYDGIARQDRTDFRHVISLVAGFVASFRREANPLMALVPIRNFDEYTFTHSINVGILNIAQGMSLGIEGLLLHDLGIAGMLHDTGKTFIDRQIIQKPGGLTEEEFAVVRSHPSYGAQYLMNQNGIPAVAVISAYEHHMRYDLQGYPKAPSSWQLNLCSQMTMVSDTFDALRTRRIYQGAWDFPKVCGRMLEVAGSQLNPDLTINFLKILATLGETLPEQPLDDAIPARNNYCE
jgi:HD-GYP domain-containing protein (c-di-GMP phosphodiesterase class II)